MSLSQPPKMTISQICSLNDFSGAFDCENF